MFTQELSDLLKNLKVDPKSKLPTLYPFLDHKGIIRVGRRLHHTPIEYTQKHPIVLPKSHHVTDNKRCALQKLARRPTDNSGNSAQ